MSVEGITFVQDVPSQVWTIQHNLYTRAPITDAYVDLDGVLVKMLPMNVRAVDLKTLEITWSTPRTGTVRVV